ncbi:protein mbtH [Streptomyces hygroscopicus subsp. hygroscopicus]|uniref:MbtH family protein n=1 Tax=Streptomyces sp. KHY 26 TaxID=3097359 RepID=UPI0024A3C8E6|nr:MbtH family NRPS accessory protein [Streptomyces hygroscopicus]GLX51531.1 protein mbtH [Streptomyces hygroscopicus subsp. hygroscopicus]
MTNPFERDDIEYYALVNEEGQYSLWPATIEVPAGWSVTRGPSDRQSVVNFIEETWTDMRPKSLVDAMNNPAR